MASAPAPAGARRAVPDVARPAVRTLRPGEMAWIAAIPCALATVAAIVLIGPVVGHALLAPSGQAFWPQTGVRPQPAQHGRFVVGLLGPPLLAAIVLANAGWQLTMRPATARVLVLVSQLVALGFVVLCFAAQNNVLFSADFVLEPHTAYFSLRTLAAAGAFALLATAVLGRAALAQQVARALRDTRRRQTASILAAALLTAVWLLTAINLDSSVGNTNEAVLRHILWTMNEPFAILNGRTPLVNFHAQYGQLWPYLAAVPMALASATLASYTITMAGISALVMLAVFATLRRVSRSSLAALGLFLPVLATSFFMEIGPPQDRYGPGNLYMVWPVRFAGPLLLAWLTARHLDRAAPRRAWLLFLAAGLAVVNNPEFGGAALAATVAAIACARAPPSRRDAARLLGAASVGLLAALGAVTLLTLVRSGQLPRFALLFEFSRLYGLDGWGALPMPVIGLHVAIFLTFAVALTVAIVRLLNRAGDALLTGMLAWSGIFGLLATGYFAGRAHPGALFDYLAPWSFTVALLVVVVVRDVSARARRGPRLPDLAVLFGFGLAVCSLAQLPTPWSQIDRLRHRTSAPVLEQREAVRLVAGTTSPGERVAILIPLGHRIAYDAHVTNVAPYSSIEAMPTPRQLTTTIRRLRAEHVRKVYVANQVTLPGESAALMRAGFAATESEGDFTALTDQGS